MKPKICLGTAQFGLAYGITNLKGKIPEQEVANILALSYDEGIYWLDTAQAYGDSENVLGRAMRKGHSFHLISKLPAQQQTSFDINDIAIWESSFIKSCDRLGVEKLDALLIHSSSDLIKPGKEHLEKWLLGLRDRGLINRLGVSIYSAQDLEGINPQLLNIVQLPFSLYDQRLLHDGTISQLYAKGVAIHARSLFLQGLLVSPSSKWPSWVPQDVRTHHQKLEAFVKKYSCSLIDICLEFASIQKALDAVVLGVCSTQELKQILTAWESPCIFEEKVFDHWAINNSASLDPRYWSK